MNITNIYLEERYYFEFNFESLLDSVQQNISTSVISLSKEFQYIFYYMLNTKPCLYWDKSAFSQTFLLLESLYSEHSDILEIDENVFNYFLMDYNSYCQLTEIVVDLKNFNVSSEIKTRLYRLPTYTSLLESCLSNFLRVIAILIGKAIGKDYSQQNTLHQLLDVIKANGYSAISDSININLRNAINHGKVLLKKRQAKKYAFFMWKSINQNLSKCHYSILI